ncbi:MAG: hypothetical protein WC658_05595 [Candidatus Omnitrophota bacterium]
MRKGILVVGILVLFVLFAGYPAFCQEQVSQPQAAVISESAAAQEQETEFIPAGEVLSVDLQKNEMLVKHLDLDSDQDKETAITVDDKTAYENIKSLAEVKPKDSVTIDYIITAEGKNLAKNITLEPPEDAVPIEEKEDVAQPEAQPSGTTQAEPIGY